MAPSLSLCSVCVFFVSVSFKVTPLPVVNIIQREEERKITKMEDFFPPLRYVYLEMTSVGKKGWPLFLPPYTLLLLLLYGLALLSTSPFFTFYGLRLHMYSEYCDTKQIHIYDQIAHVMLCGHLCGDQFKTLKINQMEIICILHIVS